MRLTNTLIEDRIIQSLVAFTVVYIAGPGQSGKITLAEHIAASRHKAKYIIFDDCKPDQQRSVIQINIYAV